MMWFKRGAEVRRISFRTLIGVVMALAALTLAACGGSGKSSTTASKKSASPASLKGQTVTFWVMNNGPKPVQDTQRIVAPFERKTGVKVNVKLVGWDVQLDRIRNAAVSGTGPDITQAGTTQVPFFAALGGFSDLSSRTGQIGGPSGYAPAVWQTTQVAGRNGTWAVPWFTETRSIYYRKDVLKKAGIDPATAFTDWNAFVHTLQTIKAKVPSINGKPIAPFGYPGKKAFDLVHNLMPFVWGAGGAELSTDHKTSTIDSPQAQQGVDFLAGLLSQGLADKSMLEKDGQGVEDAFKGGRLAVYIGGVWILSTINRSDDKTWSPEARANIGTAPMPAGPSGKAPAFIGGSDLMVFKNSKHQDAAWALLKYLSSDSVQKQYAGLMGMFPARQSAQQQVGTADPQHESFYKAIQNGRSYAPIPQWAQVETTYQSHFGDILDQAATSSTLNKSAVNKQLQAAQKQADGFLAQSTG
jgi:multiple sugar transport system substrate-binding protein